MDDTTVIMRELNFLLILGAIRFPIIPPTDVINMWNGIRLIFPAT